MSDSDRVRKLLNQFDIETAIESNIAYPNAVLHTLFADMSDYYEDCGKTPSVNFLHLFANAAILVGRYDVAVPVLERAIAEKDPYARYLLGTLYEHGRGVPKSENQSTDHYILASMDDVPMAHYRLGLAYLLGKDGVSKNRERARDCFLQAQKHHLPEAEIGLGRYYQKFGMLYRATARDHFTKVAYNSDHLPEAKYRLAKFLLNNGNFVERQGESLELLKEATDAGHNKAPFRLGVIYFEGHHNVEPDLDLAMRYFTIAGSRDNPKALDKLERYLSVLESQNEGLGSIFASRQTFPKAVDRATLIDHIEGAVDDIHCSQDLNAHNPSEAAIPARQEKTRETLILTTAHMVKPAGPRSP